MQSPCLLPRGPPAPATLRPWRSRTRRPASRGVAAARSAAGGDDSVFACALPEPSRPDDQQAVYACLLPTPAPPPRAHVLRVSTRSAQRRYALTPWHLRLPRHARAAPKWQFWRRRKAPALMAAVQALPQASARAALDNELQQVKLSQARWEEQEVRLARCAHQHCRVCARHAHSRRR
jgi:hypothetical protein